MLESILAKLGQWGLTKLYDFIKTLFQIGEIKKDEQEKANKKKEIVEKIYALEDEIKKRVKLNLSSKDLENKIIALEEELRIVVKKTNDSIL